MDITGVTTAWVVVVWLVVDKLRLLPACGWEFMSGTLDMTSEEDTMRLVTALVWVVEVPWLVTALAWVVEVPWLVTAWEVVGVDRFKLLTVCLMFELEVG